MTVYNRPTIKYSNIKLEEEKNRLKEVYKENYKDVFIDVKDESDYKIETRLKVRKKVIDSLNIPLNKLTVIDYSSHDASGTYEINYFFYGHSNTYIKYFSRANPSVTIENMEELRKDKSKLYKIYELSILNFNENLSLKSSDGSIEIYRITKIVDNKVEYFVINSLDYKIKRLRGKKLLPL